jgi:peptidoglycan hydrolase-like protein with peptidoglycan-binding domain
MFLPSNITLSPGDSGDFVSELQRRLSQAGAFSEDGINGSYDGMTTNAVRRFQSQQGLKSDGIAGPQTLRRLNGVLSGSFSSDNNDAASGDDSADEDAKKAEDLQKAFAVADNPELAEPDPFALGLSDNASMRENADPAPIELAPEAGFVPPIPAIDTQMDQLRQQEVSAANAEETPAVAQESPAPEMQTSTALDTQTAREQALAESATALASPENALTPQPPEIAIDKQHEQAILNDTAAQALASQSAANIPDDATSPSAAPASGTSQTSFASQAAQAAQAEQNITENAPNQQPAPTPEAEASAAVAADTTAAKPTTEAGAESTEIAQRPSLRQRVSAAVQKLVNYFEAKLSPSVLSEVQQIGLSLKQNGVLEKPIPADTTLSAPSATPAISGSTPDQQRQ